MKSEPGLSQPYLQHKMNYRSLLLTLFSPLLFSAVLSATVTNSPPACVVFDADWNLLAFGFKGKDYNAGTQDTWGSGLLRLVLKRPRSLTLLRYPQGYYQNW